MERDDYEKRLHSMLALLIEGKYSPQEAAEIITEITTFSDTMPALAVQYGILRRLSEIADIIEERP